MAKAKPELPKTECPGIIQFKGEQTLLFGKPHQVAQNVMTRRGVCLYCRGLLAVISRSYGEKLEEEEEEEQ